MNSMRNANGKSASNIPYFTHAFAEVNGDYDIISNGCRSRVAAVIDAIGMHSYSSQVNHGQCQASRTTSSIFTYFVHCIKIAVKFKVLKLQFNLHFKKLTNKTQKFVPHVKSCPPD